jgi:hypothetical protein
MRRHFVTANRNNNYNVNPDNGYEANVTDIYPYKLKPNTRETEMNNIGIDRL